MLPKKQQLTASSNPLKKLLHEDPVVAAPPSLLAQRPFFLSSRTEMNRSQKQFQTNELIQSAGHGRTTQKQQHLTNNNIVTRIKHENPLEKKKRSLPFLDFAMPD